MELESGPLKYLAERYAEATEYNIATLSELCSLKSSSNHRIERQIKICKTMLGVCQGYKDTILERQHMVRCFRVINFLLAPVSLEDAMKDYVAYLSFKGSRKPPAWWK